MPANPYDSRALNLLRVKVNEDLNLMHNDLGSGTQMLRDDAAATGMNCARYIGVIQGLKLALERIKETDDEMNDRKPE